MYYVWGFERDSNKGLSSQFSLRSWKSDFTAVSSTLSLLFHLATGALQRDSRDEDATLVL